MTVATYRYIRTTHRWHRILVTEEAGRPVHRSVERCNLDDVNIATVRSQTDEPTRGQRCRYCFA
jgi:hypothetical protein